MTRREQGRVNAQRWRDAHPGSAAAAAKLYRDGKRVMRNRRNPLPVKTAKSAIALSNTPGEIYVHRRFNYERKYK